MNKNYKDLIELFAASALGRECKADNDCDLIEIFKLAQQANIWPCVFSSIKKMQNEGKIQIDADTFNTLDKAVLYKRAKYASKCKYVHKVIEKLTDEGIEVLVLKGETFSHLYANKMHRTSSDTDLLIDAKDEMKATKIISDLGIEIHKKSSVSHHTRCTSEKCGLIELHTDVYEDYIDTLYFNNFAISKNNPIFVEASDSFMLKTLSVMDGLYFNTFHYIKHFLLQGCGLKQIMDLLLYIFHYKNEINFESYIEQMKKLGFETLIKSTLGIGVKYFGFDKSDLFNVNFDDEKVDDLICDIVKAGAFGNGEKERKHFNDEFLKQRLKGDYASYKASFNSNFFKKSASFKLNNIYAKYQYAKKNKYLIPFAYVYHIWYIISRSFKHIFTKKEKVDLKFTEKRIDLMKKLDILK